jgi:hypothetical protein
VKSEKIKNKKGFNRKKKIKRWNLKKGKKKESNLAGQH